MKKVLYPMLLGCIILLPLVTPAKPRAQLYLGVRSGGGAMFSQTLTHNEPAQVPNVGTVITTAHYKHTSFNIPLKLEVLLGMGGFRIGYQYGYRAAFIYRRTATYDDPQAPSVTIDYKRRANLSGHYGIVEYAFRITNRSRLALSFQGGTFLGNLKDRETKVKYKYKDNFDQRYTLGGGFNFERTTKNVTFMIGPNYTFYNLRQKTNHDNSGMYHSISLDLGFRFNLIKRG